MNNDSVKVIRPWGWFMNIHGGDFTIHKVKKLFVYPNKKLSLQSHKQRSEHWVIVSGVADVRLGNDFFTLNVGEHIFIPNNTLHRLENKGVKDLEVIEVQIGEYLGEDDIIRYEDDYGR